jgi:hypothetical protein
VNKAGSCDTVRHEPCDISGGILAQVAVGEQLADLGKIVFVEAAALEFQSAATTTIGALFRDTTANAIAVLARYQAQTNGNVGIRLNNSQLATTIAATAFKYRAGGDTAGTTYFNGRSATRLFGGVMNSFMEIRELMT